VEQKLKKYAVFDPLEKKEYYRLSSKVQKGVKGRIVISDPGRDEKLKTGMQIEGVRTRS
jgi:hypothetical protein